MYTLGLAALDLGHEGKDLRFTSDLNKNDAVPPLGYIVMSSCYFSVLIK